MISYSNRGPREGMEPLLPTVAETMSLGVYLCSRIRWPSLPPFVAPSLAPLVAPPVPPLVSRLWFLRYTLR